MTRKQTDTSRRSRTLSRPTTREGPAGRWRVAAFGLIVLVVLGVGVALAAGDLLGQREKATTADAVPVRMSMAGFTPSVISVKAGQAVAIDFWTTDAAPHLQGGIHTFISDELGIYEELPAESRRTFTLQAPTSPGDYDIYCDTCCGGKASPAMHGTLRVEA